MEGVRGGGRAALHRLRLVLPLRSRQVWLPACDCPRPGEAPARSLPASLGNAAIAGWQRAGDAAGGDTVPTRRTPLVVIAVRQTAEHARLWQVLHASSSSSVGLGQGVGALQFWAELGRGGAWLGLVSMAAALCVDCGAEGQLHLASWLRTRTLPRPSFPTPFPRTRHSLVPAQANYLWGPASAHTLMFSVRSTPGSLEL